MSSLDTIYDKPVGFKFKDSDGNVWKRVSEEHWVDTRDSSGEKWTDEELAEHIDDLNYERDMEVNFDDD